MTFYHAGNFNDHFKDDSVVGSAGSGDAIVRCAQLLRLRPLLQLALWVVNFIEDDFARILQNGSDKGSHGFESRIEVEGADQRFERGTEQVVAAAPTRG